MKLPRYFGLVDLGILTVIAVAVVLPPREMYASDVVSSGSAAGSNAAFELALEEAQTIARPDDGLATQSFARQLGEANQKDWAIDAAVRATEHAKASPTRWRTLLAASVAYVDRLDVVPGLEYANRALDACHADAASCPSWEEIRMQLYQQNLDAGVKSGINPRTDPRGFRKAGESVMREIHLGGGHDRERGSAAPTGSGSASGP
jgi:hypothetical protein